MDISHSVVVDSLVPFKQLSANVDRTVDCERCLISVRPKQGNLIVAGRQLGGVRETSTGTTL